MRKGALTASTLVFLTGASAAVDPLLETTPDSLRAANHILSTTFDQGARDLDGYAHLAKLLLHHAVNLAAQNAAQANEYKRAALPISYNLAANTWPGWGTATISQEHRKLGLEAAQLDVRLAAEVAPTMQRRFNSYWILGAHLLADRRYAEAVAAFETSRDIAVEADLDQWVTMAQGWIHLTRTLAGTDESDALAATAAKLSATGIEGAFLAAQYAAAYTEFANP